MLLDAPCADNVEMKQRDSPVYSEAEWSEKQQPQTNPLLLNCLWQSGLYT